MTTATKSRIAELQVALKAALDDMDGMSNEFKIEEKNSDGSGGGVAVSEEKGALFRKRYADAQEISMLIEAEQFGVKGRAMASAPAGDSAAMAFAAQIAGGGAPALGVEAKDVGQLFLDSEEFKNLVQSGGYTMPNAFELEGIDLTGYGKKDVYTGAVDGLNPRGFGSVQKDPMVPRQFRTQRVRDLFPVVGTNANLIDYFRVTGLTNNARPVAERTAADGVSAGDAVFGLKPQSSLNFTSAQAPVRTIAHFEVAHRNVLQDEPQLRGTINNELLYGLRLQEDYQILQGTGTGEDLLGILNTPGIQGYTQANDGAAVPTATETKPDAIRRAATRSILAYFDPTGVVIHPYDWEDIELQKDANGAYIVAANVAVGATKTIWRMPVVDSPAIPQGTFLLGAFGLGAQLYDREIANIRIAEQHADFFIRNAVVILAEQRLALAVKRPESFVKGTFVG